MVVKIYYLYGLPKLDQYQESSIQSFSKNQLPRKGRQEIFNNPRSKEIT